VLKAGVLVGIGPAVAAVFWREAGGDGHRDTGDNELLGGRRGFEAGV
jgi:hypothetical protein